MVVRRSKTEWGEEKDDEKNMVKVAELRVHHVKREMPEFSMLCNELARSFILFVAWLLVLLSVNGA